MSAAIRRARRGGKDLVDLTVSNPTVCGFDYDGIELLRPLADPASLVYDPDARGILSARKAVAEYYVGHAAAIDPGQIVLTTSTSEAYTFLFRLLCDAGDEVLVAQPSYPLFDFLAALDDVQLRSYPLFHDFGWWIDLAELERRISPRTRAVLLVHPNNPTGHATSASERKELEAICVRHRLALIVDEVFLDYGISEPVSSFASGDHCCLTFVVSGLSKIAALPQMKVGWLAACGPVDLRDEAIGRLEVIADTFLSMNGPMQHALPSWLAGSPRVQTQVLDRVRLNLETLQRQAEVGYLPVQAGWSAVMQVPQRLGSGDLAERLVEEAGVVVHPGSFYALAGEHRIVISLIGPADPFREGIKRLGTWSQTNQLTLEVLG